MNYKSSNFGLIFGLFCALVSTIPVSAAGPIIRSGESIGVESNQVLEGDFYALGQDISISGSAERDVYALGGTVTVNAPVSEDLTVVGAMVQVHGAVSDDVRVVGGEVVIAEPIKDDLVVVAESVRILSTASIGGDFIFFGGQVSIDGPVSGTVYGSAANVRIDAKVGGDVSVKAGQGLTLGDKANIGGNLTYTSPLELVRAQNASITGTVTRGESISSNDTGTTPREIVFMLLILVFSALTVFFIFRTRAARLVETMIEGFGRLGLIGLGMILAIPIIALILVTSFVGSIVGVAIMLGYMLFVLGAFMVLPMFLGVLIERALRLGSAVTIFTIILGVFVLLGLMFVPVFGPFVIFLGILISFGALCTEFYRFVKAHA